MNFLKMPLFFQHNISSTTKLAIWHIAETEKFFELSVPLPIVISHPHKRLQHLAGRYLLPLLFNDFPNHEIEIAHTRKPFLPNEQYHFSISHCRDFAAAIVSSNMRVGIDVEYITPRVEKIMHKFMHPDEVRFVNSRPPNERLKLLTVMWCVKEAIFKWYGKGEVNFSEMMRIFPFELQVKGEILAAFINEILMEKLVLHYQFLNDLVFVFVGSKVEK